ncbi:MAG: hypothetical protein U1E15_00100 [Hyphomicrobiales bacterium]
MRKVIVFMLMAALALAAAGDALAAKKKKPAAKPSTVTGAPAMSVVIVRSTEAGCEPLCPQWIEAEGEITAGTPARFEKAFKAMGKAKLPVVISSPGGNIDAALQIGRMIRKRSLDVYVGATAYAGCKPSDAQCKLPAEFQGIYRGQMLEYSAYCFSACPIVLAGGVKRFVGGFSPVGVHQAKQVWTQQQIFYREKYIIVKGKKKVISRTEVSRKMLKPQVSFGLGHGLRGKLAAYYKEMGVDTAILDEFNKAAFKDINILTPAQLDHFNLRTALSARPIFSETPSAKVRLRPIA